MRVAQVGNNQFLNQVATLLQQKGLASQYKQVRCFQETKGHIVLVTEPTQGNTFYADTSLTPEKVCEQFRKRHLPSFSLEASHGPNKHLY